MLVKKRTARTVEEIERKLDRLVRKYKLEKGKYVELSADFMSEFDALSWVNYVDQRKALVAQQAQKPTTPGVVYAIFGKQALDPHDSKDNLEKLAA